MTLWSQPASDDLQHNGSVQWSYTTHPLAARRWTTVLQAVHCGMWPPSSCSSDAILPLQGPKNKARAELYCSIDPQALNPWRRPDLRQSYVAGQSRPVYKDCSNVLRQHLTSQQHSPLASHHRNGEALHTSARLRPAHLVDKLLIPARSVVHRDTSSDSSSRGFDLASRRCYVENLDGESLPYP